MRVVKGSQVVAVVVVMGGGGRGMGDRQAAASAGGRDAHGRRRCAMEWGVGVGDVTVLAAQRTERRGHASMEVAAGFGGSSATPYTVSHHGVAECAECAALSHPP